MMSQSNISSIVTAFAISTSAPFAMACDAASDKLPLPVFSLIDQAYRSGPVMNYFDLSSEVYERAKSDDAKIDLTSIETQRRFQALKSSFFRYSQGFPKEKSDYFSRMASAICKLESNEIVSYYNDIDSSIDVVLKLKTGLTISIACFIDEDVDAPVVFSIHRGRTLLVSDELPINEVVSNINTFAF